MKKIFITATNTDVGKTYTAEKVLRHFAQLGYRVGAFKPIETGVVSTPPDATRLLKICQTCNPDFHDVTIEDICPIRFSLPAAPFTAAGGTPVSLDLPDEKLSLLEKRCDLIVIEGAGGLMVPIFENYFMVDLISRWHATPLLVTHDRLGCINDTLLSLHLLQSRSLPQNWCVNLQNESDFDTITRPYYEAHFKNFFTLQHDLDAMAKRLLSS